MASNSAQPPSTGGAHSRAPSGSTQGQNGGSGDSSANLFSSGENLWAIINNLEHRIMQQEEQIKQQAERIAVLEGNRQQQEAHLAFIAKEVDDVRSDVSHFVSEASQVKPAADVPEA
jgi:uncharacterized coiled-coil protein SlyX